MVMIMLLYDMKFWITLFEMIEPSPCVFFFPMHFLVPTQKTEAKFQILQWNPSFAYWRRKITNAIYGMKSLS